jgi:ABC-type transport system substrate-binding protein
MALVAAACGGGGGKKTAAGQTGATQAPGEGTPKVGGTLRMGLESDVATLDPAAALAQPADKVIALGIYDPLMSFDKDGKVVPYLAKSLTPSTDLKTWTLTLPTGVKFQDGTDFNSDAVVADFTRLKNPGTHCTCAPDVKPITSVTNPDPTTVVFQLDAPQVAFAQLLAGTVGYVPSPTAVRTEGADYPRKPVGTGPFKLTEFVTGDHVTVVKNPLYWKKDDRGTQLPYLDSIVFKAIPDSKVRLSTLQSGGVDLIQTADTATVKQALGDSSLKVQKVAGSSSTIILLNNKTAPFDDVRVRQAANYAINRDTYNQVIYGGVREPSYSAFATSSPYFKKDAVLPSFDLNKAKQLLQAYGKPVNVTLECIPTTEANQLLQVVQQMWQAAGFGVTLKTEEQGQYVNDIFGHRPYQSACFRDNQFVDPDQLWAGLHSGSSLNLVNYNNAAVDKALDDGRTNSDSTTRKAAYDVVQQDTSTEVPIITLLYDIFGNIYKANVHGLPSPEADSLGAIKPTTFWMG